ncbi:uncharacterized protein LOC125495607 [Beta vulgaris subsp. vulgaris]|uniref:uncharacterized protein LOC125495607 n=1 Tax=Beta vulgaris subsp. vulgaris TaxID=3555 RepID=UPI0020376874|nr:uncharacterized protein LOC125495607 [Beta vulgaris subsp. vulgaris]
MVDSRVLGFEIIKEYYEGDSDFNTIYNEWKPGIANQFNLVDGFLYKGNKLCIPKCAVRELLIREAHGGGLAGHFGINKTIDLLHEHFYWPKMHGDVRAVLARCGTCQRAKRTFHKGLYTPLPENSLGKTSVWILLWLCLECKGVRIRSWL